MWLNWVPPVKKDAPKDKEEDENEFGSGKEFINVQVTDITSGSAFYVNVVGDEKTDLVNEFVKQFNDGDVADAPEDFEPEKGMVCMGKFDVDGQFYRTRVEGLTARGSFRCTFIDFGNSAELDKADFRPGDEAISKIRPLSRSCILAAIKAPSEDSEYADDACAAFHHLTADKQLLAKVVLKDKNGKLHVVLNDPDSAISINQQLLRDGWCRLLNRPERRVKPLVKEFAADQEAAQLARHNLWQYGTYHDDSDADDDNDRRRRR